MLAHACVLHAGHQRKHSACASPAVAYSTEMRRHAPFFTHAIHLLQSLHNQPVPCSRCGGHRPSKHADSAAAKHCWWQRDIRGGHKLAIQPQPGAASKAGRCPAQAETGVQSARGL